MGILENTTRYLFFTGKGGVGKTSLASAAAITLADRRKRVLLVSTDPASNLDEVLETRLHAIPTEVPTVSGLFAMNIDPQVAAREYRERMVGPYRGVLPDASVASIEEQLSGACTTEIAAFDEFAKLLGNASATEGFDHIVFDTAPTGHTLRLLELPAAWSDYLESDAGGTSCLGPLSGLQAQRTLYAASVEALSDQEKTTLVLVGRPDRSSLIEADRTSLELSLLGVKNQHFILNGMFTAQDPSDPIAVSLEERGREAILNMPQTLAAFPRTEIPLFPFGLVGTKFLRAILNPKAAPVVTAIDSASVVTTIDIPSFESAIPVIESAGHGVIMVMGKGGVGKTTIAAAIAVELASRGHRVHLTTTDPAGQLQSALASSVQGLTVSRIDPVQETERYKAEVLAKTAMQLDENGQRLLEEELRSPCTEEMAVFRAFAEKVEAGKDGFVVLDTAPTGHTLLLLDATEAYHRQVSHTMSDLPESVRRLLPRLRDPKYTRVFIATLPEATPVHEAAQLQQDLRRAQIIPYAWIINQCLTPLTLCDPVLKAKREHEDDFIKEVRQQHASNVYMIPWIKEDLTSPDSLRETVKGHVNLGKCCKIA